VNNIKKKNRLELALEKVRGGTSCRTSKHKKQEPLNIAAEEALLVAEINALEDSIRMYNSAMDEKIVAAKADLAHMDDIASTSKGGVPAELVALRRRIRRWVSRRAEWDGSGGGSNDSDHGGTGKGPQANSESQNQEEEEEAVAAMMAVITEEEGSMLDEK
jgi:hypothetical protein